LVTFCQQASEKGYIPFAFGNLDGWPAFHQFSMMVNQMLGPEAMRALLTEGDGRWDSPEVVTAIQRYFVDLRDAGCFSEDANALNYDDGNSLFFSGQALMHPTGSWLVNDIVTNMPDYDVQFMPFPQLSEGTGRLWVSGVGSAYYITSTTQNADAAAQFLDYLFSPEVVARWVTEAQFFVPVEFDASALTVTALFGSILGEVQAASEQGTLFGSNVDVLAPPQFNEAMVSGFQGIIAGDKTPEELAAELQAAWDEGTEFEATPDGASTPAP
jgi:raffinose/stachyose/melibiose transport system substrate-binding protein